jgi:hypothetical protein
MKKVLLRWGLTVFLIMALLSGIVVTVSALPSAYTLGVSYNSSQGSYTVSGKFWTPGTGIELYLDTMDVAHFLTVANPSNTGILAVSVLIPATSVGNHVMIAYQPVSPVKQISAAFRIVNSIPVDNRTYNILTATNTEVGYLEEKLDGTRDSLVKKINENMTLAAVVISDIDDNVEDIKDQVEDVTNIESYYGDYVSDDGGIFTIFTDEHDAVRHISLTIQRIAFENLDNVTVRLRIGDDDSDPVIFKTITGESDNVTVLEFDAALWDLVFTTQGPDGSTPEVKWNYTSIGPAEKPD